MNAKSFNLFHIRFGEVKEITGYKFVRQVGEVLRLYIFKFGIESVKTRLKPFFMHNVNIMCVEIDIFKTTLIASLKFITISKKNIFYDLKKK